MLNRVVGGECVIGMISHAPPKERSHSAGPQVALLDPRTVPPHDRTGLVDPHVEYAELPRQLRTLLSRSSPRLQDRDDPGLLLTEIDAATVRVHALRVNDDRQVRLLT